jgi:glutathione S-transferase
MMKLAYASLSPFVRKVTALAIECGLEDRIERVATDPWSDSDPLPKVNPLGKVPALQLEDGTLLTGSSLICQYLDSLSPKTRLVPADAKARWHDLALEALADGVLEAGVASVVERLRRPEPYRWPAWSERQTAKITRTLDRLEGEAKAGRLDGALTLGKLTTAIVFGYLDYRRSDLEWRKGRPTLAAWYETMQQRPSLLATVPKAPA